MKLYIGGKDMFKNKWVQILVSSIIVIALAISLIFIYKKYISKQVEEGEKEIIINVIDNTKDEKYIKTYTFKTDAEFLGELLDEKMNVEWQEFGQGRYIIGVDDIIADSSKHEFWEIIVNGEGAQVGADDLTIKDGDKITLELKTWD